MKLDPNDQWRDEKVELFLLTPDRVSAAYVGWLNDPEVNRFLESRFAPQDHQRCIQFAEWALKSSDNILFGIRSCELNRHVGNIKLGPILRPHGLAEIGIMIGDQAAWGKGVGRSAIQCVSNIAAHDLGLRKLTAGCYAANAGSVKAFTKAGFNVEAVRRGHFILDGKPEDAVLMAKFINES